MDVCKLVPFAAALLLLSGCSAFTPPKAKPVIEDRVTDWGMGKIGVLATTPERRVVLIRMPEKLLCSEAPADVGESLASAIAASAQVQATGKLSDVEAGISQQFASSILQLTHRSQGIQFYRDVSYHLCTMFMNGVLTAAEVKAAHDKLLDKSDALITLEIPQIASIKQAAAPQLAAPSTPPEAKVPEKDAKPAEANKAAGAAK